MAAVYGLYPIRCHECGRGFDPKFRKYQALMLESLKSDEVNATNKNLTRAGLLSRCCRRQALGQPDAQFGESVTTQIKDEASGTTIEVEKVDVPDHVLQARSDIKTNYYQYSNNKSNILRVGKDALPKAPVVVRTRKPLLIQITKSRADELIVRNYKRKLAEARANGTQEPPIPQIMHLLNFNFDRNAAVPPYEMSGVNGVNGMKEDMDSESIYESYADSDHVTEVNAHEAKSGDGLNMIRKSVFPKSHTRFAVSDVSAALRSMHYGTSARPGAVAGLDVPASMTTKIPSTSPPVSNETNAPLPLIGNGVMPATNFPLNIGASKDVIAPVS